MSSIHTVNNVDLLLQERISLGDIVVLDKEIPEVGFINELFADILFRVQVNSIVCTEGAPSFEIKEYSYMKLPSGNAVELSKETGKKYVTSILATDTKDKLDMCMRSSGENEDPIYLTLDRGISQYLVLPFSNGHTSISLCLESHFNRDKKVWIMRKQVYLSVKDQTWKHMRIGRETDKVFDIVLKNLDATLSDVQKFRLLLETYREISTSPLTCADITGTLNQVKITSPEIHSLFEPLAIIDGIKYVVADLSGTQNMRHMCVFYSDKCIYVPYMPEDNLWRFYSDFLLTHGRDGIHPVKGTVFDNYEEFEYSEEVILTSKGLVYAGVRYVKMDGLYFPTYRLPNERELNQILKDEVDLILKLQQT